MRREVRNGLTAVSASTQEISKVDIVQLKGLTMGQWYNKQASKPDIMINASLWDEKGAIGTIFEDGKLVRDEGNGFGFGINKAGDFGFGSPWEINWRDYITGFPGLIKMSKPLDHTVNSSVQNSIRPRSVVAVAGNRIYLITSKSMNITQLKNALLDFGVYHAVNLDGGGSSRLMVNGVAINNPTDDRACPNAIAIWLKEDTNDAPTTPVTPTIPTTPTAPVTPTGKKVFIGVGHGGNDPGAQGFIIEKDANLGMALACADELRRHGVEVSLSRTKDENDPLTETIAKCNAYNPDVAIDCHNNAGGGIGFEVFHSFVGGVGKTMAEAVNAEVIAIGQRSRGVKTRKNSSGKDYYGFIRQTKSPAIIVEGVFVDTKEDAEKANTREKQKSFGVAYAKGILKTLGIAYISETTPTPEPTVLEKSELEKLADKVQVKYEFDNQTMEYLCAYKYAEALLERLV